MWQLNPQSVRFAVEKIGNPPSQVLLCVDLALSNAHHDSPQFHSTSTILSSSLQLDLTTSRQARLLLYSFPHYTTSDSGGHINYKVELPRDSLVRFEQARNGDELSCSLTVEGLESVSELRAINMYSDPVVVLPDQQKFFAVAHSVREPTFAPAVQKTRTFRVAQSVPSLTREVWVGQVICAALGRRSVIVEVQLPDLSRLNLNGGNEDVKKVFEKVFRHLEEMVRYARERNTPGVFSEARFAADQFFETNDHKLFLLVPLLKKYIEHRYEWSGKHVQPWSKRWEMFLNLRRIINEGHHCYQGSDAAMFIAVELPPLMWWFIQHATELLNSGWQPPKASHAVSSGSDDEDEDEDGDANRRLWQAQERAKRP